MPENKRLAFYSGIQTNQILTNDDEVCIPRLSSILLAVQSLAISAWINSIVSCFRIHVVSTYYSVRAVIHFFFCVHLQNVHIKVFLDWY